MIENLPGYVSITFILTTLTAIGFLLYAVKQTVFDTIPAKILIFLLALQTIFQAILAFGNFYNDLKTPPRLLTVGILPALWAILAYFVFFRQNFVEKLPLQTLTILSIIRIPVEIVLLWLFQNDLVPQSMTFEGRNFDILSGITAPIIWFIAFRGGKIKRSLLILWNIFALALLFNIVITAILAFPALNPNAPAESLNRAVSYFPFIWLPTVVVPIVFFSHLASLWKLFKNSTN